MALLFGIDSLEWIGGQGNAPLVTVDGVSRIWGDADCNGSVTARDNQAILKNVLQQPPISQTEPCPDVGTEVALS